mmetsp:Transcript_3215/g.3484  ORF Transcript_3215/g.3484 Transcript_3215/m.3484 type:complete len:961 (-) Transcript_3215:55-2937(-)
MPPLKKITGDLIDQILHKYPNLKSLNLANNVIEVIENLEKVNLLKLDLSHNRITRITELHYFANLSEINLSHNMIESLQGLSQLLNLQALDIGHNRISSISELTHIQMLPRIDKLVLAGNPAARDPSYYIAIKQAFPLLLTLDGRYIAEIFHEIESTSNSSITNTLSQNYPSIEGSHGRDPNDSSFNSDYIKNNTRINAHHQNLLSFGGTFQNAPRMDLSLNVGSIISGDNKGLTSGNQTGDSFYSTMKTNSVALQGAGFSGIEQSKAGTDASIGDYFQSQQTQNPNGSYFSPIVTPTEEFYKPKNGLEGEVNSKSVHSSTNPLQSNPSREGDVNHLYSADYVGAQFRKSTIQEVDSHGSLAQMSSTSTQSSKKYPSFSNINEEVSFLRNELQALSRLVQQQDSFIIAETQKYNDQNVENLNCDIYSGVLDQWRQHCFQMFMNIKMTDRTNKIEQQKRLQRERTLNEKITELQEENKSLLARIEEEKQHSQQLEARHVEELEKIQEENESFKTKLQSQTMKVKIDKENIMKMVSEFTSVFKADTQNTLDKATSKIRELETELGRIEPLVRRQFFLKLRQKSEVSSETRQLQDALKRIQSYICVKLGESIFLDSFDKFDLKEFQSTIERLVKQRDELDFQLKSSQSSLTQTEAENRLKYESQISNLTSTTTALQEQLTSKNHEIQRYESQISQKNTQISTLSSQLSGRETEILTLKSQLTSLENHQQTSISQARTETQSQYEAKINALTSEIGDKEQLTVSIKHDLQLAQDEVSSLKDEINRQEEEREQILATHFKSKDTEIRKLKQERNALLKELKSREAQLKTGTGKNDVGMSTGRTHEYTSYGSVKQSPLRGYGDSFSISEFDAGEKGRTVGSASARGLQGSERREMKQQHHQQQQSQFGKPFDSEDITVPLENFQALLDSKGLRPYSEQGSLAMESNDLERLNNLESISQNLLDDDF